MLKAFFDDSGTDCSGPICLVAGYIAEAVAWERFSEHWAQTLHATPRIDYLKMAEAEARKGQFAGWDKSSVEVKLTAFARIIRETVLGSVGSMVGCRNYALFAKGRVPETVDHPYWLCFVGVKLTTLMLYRDRCGDGKIDFVFDQQSLGFSRRGTLLHEGWWDVLTESCSDVLGEIEFHDDKQVLPLQAADMIAWHLRRHGAAILSGRCEDRPAADILGDVPVFTHDWPAEKLESFVTGYQKMHPDSPINRSPKHV
jgi:hypothetical protein